MDFSGLLGSGLSVHFVLNSSGDPERSHAAEGSNESVPLPQSQIISQEDGGREAT